MGRIEPADPPQKVLDRVTELWQNWDSKTAPRKPLDWVGASKEELLEFPETVIDRIGYALDLVQCGLTPVGAKPLRGLGSGVLELIEDFDGETYRAVYTVRMKDVLYVLHCFQKKSKTGIATPKRNIGVIEMRLKKVEGERRKWQNAKTKKK